ncbi:hypothetical protein GCM10022408_06580 [Hymenobacter fastidiosus]|uniref:Secreted protein n=1 Tax=Hymenobacter fastidiosus TaxID=486264 RepID=A0ABP7RJW5_9BACT
MWYRYSLFLLVLGFGLPVENSAQAQRRTSKAKPNRARSGAYSRYDRTGRRNEADMRLAPGMRINMPSPPTTDYMGRPLKKKVPKPTSANSTLTSGQTAPAPTNKPVSRPVKRKK